MSRKGHLGLHAIAAILLTTLSIAAPTAAQATEGPTDDVQVYLLIAAPGHNDPSAWYGHAGLLVRGPDTDSPSHYYTFQLFLGDGIERVLVTGSGNAEFVMVRFTEADIIADYAAQGREVRITPLHLAHQTAAALAADLETMAEEREPLPYDILLDNCSTRIRDLLDPVLGGALRNATVGVVGPSLRELAKPYVDHAPIVTFGLSMLLNGEGDEPLDRWDGMLFPLELEAAVRATDIAGEPSVILEASRVNEARQPTAFAIGPIVAGLVFAALFVVTGVFGRQERAGRAWLAGLIAATSFLLLIPTLFTTVAYSGVLGAPWKHTENILLLHPLVLLMTPAAIWAAFDGLRAWRTLLGITAITALAAIVAIAIKILPGGQQDNLPHLIVFVPLWLSVAIAVSLAHYAKMEPDPSANQPMSP